MRKCSFFPCTELLMKNVCKAPSYPPKQNKRKNAYFHLLKFTDAMYSKENCMNVGPLDSAGIFIHMYLFILRNID